MAAPYTINLLVAAPAGASAGMNGAAVVDLSCSSADYVADALEAVGEELGAPLSAPWGLVFAGRRLPDTQKLQKYFPMRAQRFYCHLEDSRAVTAHHIHVARIGAKLQVWAHHGRRGLHQLLNAIAHERVAAERAAAEEKLHDTYHAQMEREHDYVSLQIEATADVQPQYESQEMVELGNGWVEVRRMHDAQVYYWHRWTGVVQYESPWN